MNEPTTDNNSTLDFVFSNISGRTGTLFCSLIVKFVEFPSQNNFLILYKVKSIFFLGVYAESQSFS